LTVAERLGMSINEVYEKHTERQVAVWHAHFQQRFREEIENPVNPVIWYLMQVAAEIRVDHVKNPRDVKIGDLKLVLEHHGKSDFKPTKEMHEQMALAQGLMATLGPEGMRQWLKDRGQWDKPVKVSDMTRGKHGKW
jgi:hypothetical protein